jgi:glycosyltransferase involved in cell wall biosynthesis
MLSVVIATQDSERTLVPTLAALVAGAVAGVVREVIVADSGSGDASAEIAEGAGCRVLISSEPQGARLKAAAAVARAPWLLFLAPGLVPDSTWIDECKRFIEQAELGQTADQRAAGFREVSATFRPMLVEALALLLAAVGGRRLRAHGLLIARSLYDRLGAHRPDAAEPESDLIRRLGRRRLVLLRTGAMIAAKDIT